MDSKKFGSFLKVLRKEKGLTQEQLAQQLNVSGRTISRWETGSNMPDLDILIEMSDFYEVDIRELIDGERKSEKMNKETEETVLKIADYSNEEKNRLMNKLHIFSWIGVITFIIFLVLEAMGLADSGVTENIASFCCGISFGMLIICVIYTSRYIYKFKSFKKRLLHRN
ncbi:helix-turn-helix domain-containing protein [Intestinibacter sp.]